MKHRIAFLDGLRGVAILMVVLFHAYARWPDIVPYGNQYEFLLFKFGFLGVQLFFLISGFVILLTLENCKDIKEFVFKRWLRLFPAMFFCSLTIFLTANLFHERPAGNPTLVSLLPGMLFIEPSWINNLVGISINPLEGAFWSLYVEFKFYIVAGSIYFLLGRTRLVIALFGLSLIGILSHGLSSITQWPAANLLSKISQVTSIDHFGWFAAGASVYVFTRTGNTKWIVVACCFAVCSSVLLRFGNAEITIAALAVSALFVFSFGCQWLQGILNGKVVQFFGFISYPLYLLHENAMIASIVKLGGIIGDIPRFILPLIPIAGLAIFSYLCAKYVEPTIRSLIRTCLSGVNYYVNKLKGA
ncbi:acyltransferase family protein [Thauera sinica]|uniref:Acyltransferase family protein n=1 Tax=Thauera sinica TaxID=2665146 RepID=A0ABW1ANU3_9RHOO|nr:acyltransferase [Thauera sp. K11]ATE60523.1 hypothetical protein CCZ27_11715 [Thauera sp. K11]